VAAAAAAKTLQCWSEQLALLQIEEKR
jgi:hypothetical protein